MSVAAPFRAAGGHLEIELRGGVRALYTSRAGGVSAPPYDTLNLGRLTADDPAAVDRNRDTLAELSGISRERVLQGRQVHGARVARSRAPAAPGAELRAADGQATSSPGLAPLVLTADCMAVAVSCDGALAVLHAGWRGLAAGILAEGVAALRELGGAGPLEAAIGPAAGACCYEVGPEVHEALDALGHGGTRLPGGRVDLEAIATRELRARGAERVHGAGICTICDRRWFSHRRDGETGRQAGIAWSS